MKQWTAKQENQLIELCLSGVPLYMIRKTMHVSGNTLNAKLNDMGLDASLWKHGWTASEWKLLNDMTSNGHTCSEIAQALETNYDRVYYALQLIKGVTKRDSLDIEQKKRTKMCGDCDDWQPRQTRIQLLKFGTCLTTGKKTERCDFCKNTSTNM